MNTFETFAGKYEGFGSWHDSACNSMGYKIIQTNTACAQGFDITFNHDFEDGSIVEAHFNMIWIATYLFRVDVAGVAIGNGYLFDDYCHYHMKVGEAFVEASYRAVDGGLKVFGSSSRNADGNYIGWRETLQRAAS